MVLRQARVRDLSAQLLGLGPDWRAVAARRLTEIDRARADAAVIVQPAAQPAAQPVGAAAAAMPPPVRPFSLAAAAPRRGAADAGVAADEGAPKAPPPVSRLDRASRFPAWRRVKPPARAARDESGDGGSRTPAAAAALRPAPPRAARPPREP